MYNQSVQKFPDNNIAAERILQINEAFYARLLRLRLRDFPYLKIDHLFSPLQNKYNFLPVSNGHGKQKSHDLWK